MIVAIASGKGGAGKTTVAVNLALTLARRDRPVHLIDADVEEPNVRLFLDLEEVTTHRVTVPCPVVEPDLCEQCGVCSDHCRFGAILVLGEGVTVFTELCHGCGGCTLVCPTHALTEQPREMGTLESGRGHGLRFTGGRIDVSEPRAVPLIQAAKARIRPDEIALVDAPPGSGCSMMEAVAGSDLVCFVAEPTPFGISDLELAMAAVEQLGLPFGVVVNRRDLGDGELESRLAARGVEVFASLPEDRRIAEVTSRGERVIESVPEHCGAFETLADRIEARLAAGAGSRLTRQGAA